MVKHKCAFTFARTCQTSCRRAISHSHQQSVREFQWLTSSPAIAVVRLLNFNLCDRCVGGILLEFSFAFP